ncbi:MAG: helix-turn-helix domain-containing protein, partial [Pseudolabrys sp.]
MKRSKHQTRLRILDAAFGLFWRQGFLRVSMDEIAARAGITKRALYQHFPSKDDL